MTSALRMSRQATQPSQPPTNKTDIYIDTDGDLAYIRPDGAVGKIKGGGDLNLAGYDLTLGADVTLAGSVAGGGTVSVPTGQTAAFARGGTALVRGSNPTAGRVPFMSTNTDVLDAAVDLSFDSTARRLYAYRALIDDYASIARARLVEQGSTPDAVASHTVVFVDSGGDLCWRKDGGEVVKLASAGTYTLTIPATGTVALLETAQTFSAAQTFSNVLTAPGIKPASDSTTAVQIQNAAGTAIITVDTSNNLVDLHRHQIVPITTTAKATSSTYDMTVTFPSATTRLFCEFRGWILDNNSASSMTAFRFTFRIIKSSSGSATFAAIGEFEKIAPVSGVAVSGVTVQSTSDTTVVIRVTMDGTSVGSLLVGGTLLVSGGTNRVTAAAFA